MSAPGPGCCPRDDVLSRAFTDGAEATLEAHLAGCAECSAAWRDLGELADVARELAPAPLSHERSAAMRAALMEEAAAEPVARPPSGRSVARWVALAAAATLFLGAGAAGMAWLRPPAEPEQLIRLVEAPVPKPAYRGTVMAQPGTRMARLGEAPDEVVRLVQGSVTCEVAHLAEGERFRVITGDAEVEVRGTAFDVVAEEDRLVRVRVIHGVVEVRPAGRPSVSLEPGGEWSADAPPSEVDVAAVATPEPEPVAPAVVEVEVEASSLAPRRLRKARRASARRVEAHAEAASEPAAEPEAAEAEARTEVDEAEAEPTTEEVAFQAGWTAMRERRFSEAADAFDRVKNGPWSALTEDATYWKAVALARGGAATRAVGAFEAYLAAYARAPRAGEASAMLGWLLLEAGDREGARTRFIKAAADARPRARDSGLAGLDALHP